MCPLLSRRVPKEVVVSRASLDALETLEIERTLISRAALLSGSLVERGGEVLLRSTSDDVHVVITLVNDTWRLSTIEEDVAGSRAATHRDRTFAQHRQPETSAPASYMYYEYS